ncbi:Biopolymer transport protein ExbD/TolR [hydrothermal vent metagenome]|uniref:Biopolymer transport protein ExbD/TolR n=1 Tax=hydrothermal vent metagenome TaxID=652676 RepID=A0A3B1CRQ3_9ZZZZ
MRFRNEDDEDFGMDMTPMIDVVFLLLIFFMVSTVFVDFNRQMDLSLPTSKSSRVDETPKSLEIEMTADKQIFFDGKKVTLSRIEKMLGSSTPEQKKTAIIRADKILPYGDVIKLMGILQSAGVLDISVAVK